MSKFYHFNQNNSGGSFDINDKEGIGVDVWIEANDPAHANYLAEIIGIYFNGCDNGMDCNCCGDRWSELWIEDKGEIEPQVNQDYSFSWHDTVYVHKLDKTIERIKNNEPRN